MSLIKRIKEQIDLRSVIKLEQGKDGPDYKYGLCPFHENDGQVHKTASFLVYKKNFNCMSTNCGVRGDIFDWYAHVLYGDIKLTKPRFKDILEAVKRDYPSLKEEYEAKVEPEVKVKKKSLDKIIRSYHEVLMGEPKRVAYFLSRGFTLRTIREQMFGWDGTHYVIPVWRGLPGRSGVESVRLRASKKGEIRYSGFRDQNSRTIYNAEAFLVAAKIELPFLLVFYGELDAQLAWQLNLPAISSTNGALAFKAEWLNGYKGDVIFIGDKNEEKAASDDASVFGSRGWTAHLPEDKGKDFTEMISNGVTVKQFLLRLMLFYPFKRNVIRGIKQVIYYKKKKRRKLNEG